MLNLPSIVLPPLPELVQLRAVSAAPALIDQPHCPCGAVHDSIGRRAALLGLGAMFLAPSASANDWSRDGLIDGSMRVQSGNSSSMAVPASEIRVDAPASNQRQHGQGPSIAKWPGRMDTRQIWIKRQQSGEEVIARYVDRGQFNYQEYVRICSALRDVRAGLVAHIDVELLDLIFAIQNWLVSWGIDRPMIITSGFRSAKTNSSTEGAARNSMHVHGRAVDARIPGISAEYLGRLAAIFTAGGVGFYPSRNFIHLDTGRVRYWRSS